MSEEENGQEKTLEATQRRLEQSKEEGQVARSRELGMVLILLVGTATLMMTGANVMQALTGLIHTTYTLPYNELMDLSSAMLHIQENLVQVLLSLLPLFAAVFIIPLILPFVYGGWIFSMSSLGFKGSRVNPLAGVKRMFSITSVVNLVKSIIKLVLLLGVGILLLRHQFSHIMVLTDLPLRQAIANGIGIVSFTFLILVASFFLIGFSDAIYQYWTHTKSLRMSLEEVKRESKESEGSPEVKGKVRRLQQEMARKRMMNDVPNASVIVTNPEHYAVALMYDENQNGAPRVVAKGVDLVSEAIRSIAIKHNITILAAPPLARAIYYSTDIGQEIPGGLYVAVAKILAYVYQLKRYNAGYSRMPTTIAENDLPIPVELKR